MGIGRPSKLTAKSGDGTVHFQWSPVVSASLYELHINCLDTAETSIDRTTETSFTKNGLKNGLYYAAQIIATDHQRRSSPSEAIIVVPGEQQSSFEFLAECANDSDKINLTWTVVPTSSYYRIERYNIKLENNFTSITTINNNKVSTFQDQTCCNSSHVRCEGHYYRIFVCNNTTSSNQSKLSSKIFCKMRVERDKCIIPSTDDNYDSHCSTISTTSNDVENDKNSSIDICEGDLITQQTDVIVVCSSSKYLFDTICKAGGDSMKASFNAKLNKTPDASVIAVKAEGRITSKMIYFLRWKTNDDASLLRKSIETFVANAIARAVLEGHKSITFPAIGCGQLACSVSLVAQTMVEEAHRKSQKHGISIKFVIQPGRTDVFDEFQKQINLMQQPSLATVPVKPMSVAVNKGIIEVEMGDITAQKVDVIIGSSSSEFLRKAIIKAAGEEVETAYNIEYKNNSNAILISTPAGTLPCKRIFFVKWQPDKDEAKLRQSLIALIWTVIQHVISYNFTSLAFPAIGCGQHGCSVDIVVKTLVKNMKNQLTIRNLPLAVKFVIQHDQKHVYDEFCKQLLATQDDVPGSMNYQVPTTWEKSKDKKIRFELSNTSDDYKSILTNFDQAMKGKYKQIIRIERIQNERWYIQYLAHSHNFRTRLNSDTEKTLYHGCPEHAVNLILEDCFNRSFAGVNGTAYGVGVYFSSNAAYSHGYTKPNANEERNMFVARVLIGNTTKGNGSMKTRPIGFDSTTDGNHIFVTYHDAQAYAEYLITYK